MNFLDKILKFYIHSSLHVAFAVVAFVGVTYLDFGLKFDLWLMGFVFFSTILAYTFVKHIHLIREKKFQWSLKLKLIFLFAALSSIPITISLFHFDAELISIMVGLGIFTLLYVLPFLPKAKNLRDVSGLKIFIIALVWSGATVVLPLFSFENAISWYEANILYYISSRFCFVIALIIPFEIRDLKLDDIYLKTLPQVLGVMKTKLLAIVLVLGSCFFLNSAQVESSAYMIIHVLMIILILGSKKQKAFLYTAFVVESVPILWFALKYFAF